jgi:hypothetical protein
MGGREYVVKSTRYTNLMIFAVDNTLSLLYTSAASRGLPHDVVRNLASLQRRHVTWEKYNRPAEVWNPKLPPSEYQIKASKASTMQSGGGNKLDEKAWNALNEVVRMAEGRNGLILGRVKNKQRSRWKQ